MDFETMLSQLEATRPDLSDSLAVLRQYNNNQKKTETVAEDDSRETVRLIAILEKQRNINKTLLLRYEQLETNYGLLIDQLDQLAEGAGACPQCWGEDRTCNRCNGRGKPGFYQPNTQYFDYYIKPVLRKLKKTPAN